MTQTQTRPHLNGRTRSPQTGLGPEAQDLAPTAQQKQPVEKLANAEKYEALVAYADPVQRPSREIVGREKELEQVLSSMHRPELSNVLLIAPAGSGKTALVQATKMHDLSRIYIELDVSRLVSGVPHPNEMAVRLKKFFDEAEAYSKQEGQDIVIFIDEFHQIPQMSPAGVEALKPVLAASGTRGIRVIAATTFDEYHEWIVPNQPLDERLQRINLSPADDAMTVKILKGMAERYGVGEQFVDDHIFHQIVEWTNRYIPRSTQPRKSLRLMDAMIGWHRYTGEPMSSDLLAQMLKQMTGINVAFSVDGDTIKERLDAKVFSQSAATSVLSRRLQLSVADLNDKSRPQMSALFTGSTGTGKSVVRNEPVAVYDLSDGGVRWKEHGDLRPGDRVFGRDGTPVEIKAVFPQEKQDIYRVTLTDGRTLDVNGPHLWSVYTAKTRSNKHAGKHVEPKVMETREMVDAGVVRTYPGDSRKHLKYFIPANEAAQWPERELPVDPWMLGVFIGNGSMREKPLTLSSDDGDVNERVAQILTEYEGGLVKAVRNASNYHVTFDLPEPVDTGGGSVAVKIGRPRTKVYADDVFAGVDGLVGVYSRDRRIPQEYLTASVEQRWELVRGLFDTDGHIGGQDDSRYNVSYSTMSAGLAEDVRSLLFSLGVSNRINCYTREREGRVMEEWHVHVSVAAEEKERFFWLPRKKAIARQAALHSGNRERVKKFDMVGIASIEKLEEQQEADCIWVDHPEHLYQAGSGFVVTHNTEMTKQLATVLFGDDSNRLIRFDMTEFALETSLSAFKTELTQKVANMGHAVILFDEIEKANPVITRLLLQILDDGRMRDDHGKQVSFLNCYIILTTNAASEVYETIAQYSADDDGSAGAMEYYRKVITDSIMRVNSGFPPELLGRIDAIVPFQPLSRNTQKKIVKKKLFDLRQTVYTRHGVKMRIDPNVLRYIIEDKVETDTTSGGARGAVRLINDEVATEVATFLNRNPGVRDIQVLVSGEMRADNKHMLNSEAEIVVREAIMSDTL